MARVADPQGQVVSGLYGRLAADIEADYAQWLDNSHRRGLFSWQHRLDAARSRQPINVYRMELPAAAREHLTSMRVQVSPDDSVIAYTGDEMPLFLAEMGELSANDLRRVL